MEIYKILRKRVPTFVLKMKVKDLDISRCSHMFRQTTYSLEQEVYVKCDEHGEIVYRSRKHKDEYSLFKVDDYHIYDTICK